MCGLAGVFLLRGAAGERHRAQVKVMTEALRHRGPDEAGYWDDARAVLGHRRLSIIDREGGKQPMTGPRGRTLVFNGEIYNYRLLRRAEEARGRRFVTRSDTESLLAVLESRGKSALPELKGMFAFACYDPHTAELVLATDALGKKPLYYAVRDDELIFASELRALLRHPACGRDIDRRALEQYLLFEYVPAPRTILQGVRKLEAGTCLVADGGGTRVERYHRMDLTPEFGRGIEEWRRGFDLRMREAVKRRLVSEAPLGIFLSGGLDSSSVLAAAARWEPERRFKTFTIEFEEKDFDESVWARRVSALYRTEHVTEKCPASRMLEEHRAILALQDEPLADASFIPTYMLCRLARRHVTVCLSGDGGDELLMGYPTFEAAEWAERFGWMPRTAIGILEAMARRLPASYGNLTADFKLKQFLKGLCYAPPLRDQVWLGSFAPSEICRLLGQSSDPDEPLKNLCGNSGEALKDLQEFYFRFYLQGDILVKVDRASMANSLEVRSPFLDEELVDYTLRAPSAVLRAGGTPKALLRSTVAAELPSDIRRRPKKGFGIPIARWIRGPLKTEFARTLSAERLRIDGHFDTAQVESMLREHWSGKVDHRKKLWTLYAFQKWKESAIG